MMNIKSTASGGPLAHLQRRLNDWSRPETHQDFEDWLYPIQKVFDDALLHGQLTLEELALPVQKSFNELKKKSQNAWGNLTGIFEREDGERSSCPRCKGSGLLQKESPLGWKSPLLSGGEPCWFCEGIGVMPIVDLSGYLVARSPTRFRTRDPPPKSPRRDVDVRLHLGKFPGSRCKLRTLRVAGGIKQLLFDPFRVPRWLLEADPDAAPHWRASPPIARKLAAPEWRRLWPSAGTGSRTSTGSSTPASPRGAGSAGSSQSWHPQSPQPLSSRGGTPAAGSGGATSGSQQHKRRTSVRTLSPRRGLPPCTPKGEEVATPRTPSHSQRPCQPPACTPSRIGTRPPAVHCFSSGSLQSNIAGPSSPTYGGIPGSVTHCVRPERTGRSSYGRAAPACSSDSDDLEGLDILSEAGGWSPRGPSSPRTPTSRGGRTPRRERNRIREKAERDAIERAKQITSRLVVTPVQRQMDEQLGSDLVIEVGEGRGAVHVGEGAAGSLHANESGKEGLARSQRGNSRGSPMVNATLKGTTTTTTTTREGGGRGLQSTPSVEPGFEKEKSHMNLLRRQGGDKVAVLKKAGLFGLKKLLQPLFKPLSNSTTIRQDVGVPALRSLVGATAVIGPVRKLPSNIMSSDFLPVVSVGAKGVSREIGVDGTVKVAAASSSAVRDSFPVVSVGMKGVGKEEGADGKGTVASVSSNMSKGQAKNR